MVGNGRRLIQITDRLRLVDICRRWRLIVDFRWLRYDTLLGYIARVGYWGPRNVVIRQLKSRTLA